jgi:predicted Kef-type K+ transport protein
MDLTTTQITHAFCLAFRNGSVILRAWGEEREEVMGTGTVVLGWVVWAAVVAVLEVLTERRVR